MKGNNDLHLNHATIIEALQEYFDKRMGEYSPQVVCVSQKNDIVVVSVSDKEWCGGIIQMAREDKG